jgi:hypothetical protein
MAHDTVLRVFVIIIAIAFVAQAVVIAGLLLVVRRWYREFVQIHAEAKAIVDPIAAGVTEIIQSAREPVRAMGENLVEVTGTLRDRVRQADVVMADLLERCRLQIARADELVSRLAASIESTAGVVQSKVMAPVREVSAVLAGVRTGLDFLFARRRATTARSAGEDENLFI